MKNNKIKQFVTVCLLMVGSTSQAALIEMFNTDLSGLALDSILEAEAIIAASAGADFSTNLNFVDFNGNSFPGADFGAPPLDRFVMRVTGTINTDVYAQLFMRHDDGFVVRIGGLDFFAFNGNTAPITTSSGALANNSIQTFEMIFWDQGGAQVAILRGDKNERLVYIGDPVSVPEPGTLALLGLGLFGMGLARARKQA